WLPHEIRPAAYGSTPPILHTMAHSCGLTGCTESRELLTSTISANSGTVLISSRVTGLSKALTASTSTHSQRGSSVVESGWTSWATRTMPTTAFCLTE